MSYIRFFFPTRKKKRRRSQIIFESKKQPLIDARRYSTESKQLLEEWQAYGLPSRSDCLSLDHDGIYDVG